MLSSFGKLCLNTATAWLGRPPVCVPALGTEGHTLFAFWRIVSANGQWGSRAWAGGWRERGASREGGEGRRTGHLGAGGVGRGDWEVPRKGRLVASVGPPARGWGGPAGPPAPEPREDTAVRLPSVHSRRTRALLTDARSRLPLGQCPGDRLPGGPFQTPRRPGGSRRVCPALQGARTAAGQRPRASGH